jgi:hypothetical protein
LPKPPEWAKLKLRVSLTLDKSWGQRHPGRKSRKKAVKYDKRRYKRRNRIEIMFGRLKDWRRVATRYDRCPETFFSAIMLAATVLFRLSKAMSLGPGQVLSIICN